MKMKIKAPKVGKRQLIALVAIAAIVIVVIVVRGGGDSTAKQDVLITPRAVERRTLTDVLTVSGEVRREEVQSVKSAITGQVNSVSVEDGATVEAGNDLFAIDGRTAVAVDGDFPFFRTLQVGSQGSDVQQLETILTSEGFDVGDVDSSFTEATRSGLAAWQSAHGYGSNGAEGDETVAISLLPNAAGYSIGKANSAAYVIGPAQSTGPGSSWHPSVDTPPEMEISASDTEVEEGQTITVSLQASEDLTEDATIDLSISGSAVEGSDFSVVPRSVSMRDGQAYESFDITIYEDEVLESAEDIVISVIGGASSAFTLGSSYRTRIVIGDETDGVSRQLSLTTSNTSVREGSTATFIVTSTTAVNRELRFDVSYSGSAASTTDYLVATPDQLVLPAGRYSTQFSIQTRQDDAPEPDESLTVTLIPRESDSGGGAYTVGTSSATVTIESSELPELTVRGGGRVAEGSSGAFRIVADAPVAEDTSINYQLSGTATPGLDYSVQAGTVLMKAGSSSVTVPIVALSDDVVFQPSDMVVAKWPAKVGAVAVEEGDYVAPGQSVLNITDPQFTVKLKVGAAERADLEVGQKAAVDLSVGDQILEGVISSLDETAGVGANGEQIYEGVVTVQGDFEAVDGATVSVDVTLSEVVDALAVPVAAILRSADGDEVRIVNDQGTITRVPVTIGLVDREWAQVLTGLKGDELVVVDVVTDGVAAGT